MKVTKCTVIDIKKKTKTRQQHRIFQRRDLLYVIVSYMMPRQRVGCYAALAGVATMAFPMPCRAWCTVLNTQFVKKAEMDKILHGKGSVAVSCLAGRWKKHGDKHSVCIFFDGKDLAAQDTQLCCGQKFAIKTLGSGWYQYFAEIGEASWHVDGIRIRFSNGRTWRKV